MTRPRVTVIDYGRGNILSITRGLAKVGSDVSVTTDPAEISQAERLVLPGVGAFADGMAGLRERGLIEPLREFGRSGRPLLGICLGMQLLLSESEEFGVHQGLGLVPGRVVRFREPRSGGPRYKIPHVGWAPLAIADNGHQWKDSPFASLPPGGFVYFVHSFHAEPDEPGSWLSTTPYGGQDFCSALMAHGAVMGCQFHPEKSGETGLAILRNWVRYQPHTPPPP